MKIRNWIVLSFCISSASVAIYATGSRRARAISEQEEAFSSQDLRVDGALNKPSAPEAPLTVDVAPRARRLVPPASTTGQPAPAESQPAGGERDSSTEPRPRSTEASDAMFAQYRNLLETTFEHQPLDSAWSFETEKRVLDLLSEKLPESSNVANISCRSSLCRLEVAHEGGVEAHRTFIATMGTRGAWDGPGAFLWHPGAQGEATTLVYLGRDGDALPSLPAATD